MSDCIDRTKFGIFKISESMYAKPDSVRKLLRLFSKCIITRVAADETSLIYFAFSDMFEENFDYGYGVHDSYEYNLSFDELTGEWRAQRVSADEFTGYKS
jgi:hypothetical protein